MKKLIEYSEEEQAIINVLIKWQYSLSDGYRYYCQNGTYYQDRGEADDLGTCADIAREILEALAND